MIEGFFEVRDKKFDAFSFDDDVVDISRDVSLKLIMEAFLDSSLVRGAGVFEPERHRLIAVRTERSYKGCLNLVFFFQRDLMVT